MRKYFTLYVLTLLSAIPAFSQQILTENFAYTSGQALTANGWTQIGTTATSPIQVPSGGLIYSGYANSGIGNAVNMVNSGQDVYKDLPYPVSTGSIYTAFMVRFDTIRTGDYFCAYLPSNSTTNYGSRVFVKSASAGYFRIGISKINETASYSADSFAIGSTGLLVMKYRINSGSNNDTVAVYYFTSGFPATEPSPLIYSTGSTVSDLTNVGRFALRQGTAASAPHLGLDGIRVAARWEHLNAGSFTYPAPVTAVTAGSITPYSVKLQFTKTSLYDSANQTLLVFLKKGTSVSTGFPSNLISTYSADTNFQTASSKYENDSAYCVYKGDGSSVSVSGLEKISDYIAFAYVAADSNSYYSIPSPIATFTTLSTAPDTAKAVTVTGTSATSIKVSWTKGNNYNNANHTQLVFVKELSAVNQGVNTANPLNIIANSDFTGASGLYQNDPLAKCVFNGDTNFVNVTGLNPGTRYYVLVLGVSTSDSLYSTGATNSGLTLTGGPAALSNLRFVGRVENNSTISWSKPSAYIDSLHNVIVFVRKDSMLSSSFPIPTHSALSYIADADYNGASASRFEYDSLAHCVYNGDSSSVTVSGLSLNTTYYAFAYVSNTDTALYSSMVFTSGKTMPDVPTALSFTGVSTSSATITWTSPAGYTAGTMGYLVFVKPNSAVNAGTPTRAYTRYTASTTLGNGSRYQNDTLAYCVYRGALNSVTISNLVAGIPYHVLIYINRIADSVYTHPATVSGTTAGPAPLHPIGPLVNVTANGVVDSTGKRATVRGVVYSVNFRPVGLLFVIRDQTGGIAISSNTKNFQYTPVIGDSVEASGTVSQTNGWAVLTSLDTVIMHGTAGSLNSPVSVNSLSESTENQLVSVARVKSISTSKYWPTNGNVTTINQATGDTVIIRMYQSTGIGGKVIPTGEFEVVGVGIQISSSSTAPFANNGYYLAPRIAEDIIPATDSLYAFQMTVPSANMRVILGGDPATTFNYSNSTARLLYGTGPVYYSLLVDEPGQDWTTPLFVSLTSAGGLDSSGSLTYKNIADSLGLTFGDSIVTQATMIAFTPRGSYRLASQVVQITFVRDAFTGYEQINKNIHLNVYPNPSGSIVKIDCSESVSSYELRDLSGRLISAGNGNSFDVSEITSGLYLVSVYTDKGVAVKRIKVTH